MLSIVLDVTFAAVSSDGVRTSDGKQRRLRGRNTVPATRRERDERVHGGRGPVRRDHRRPRRASARSATTSLDTITVTRGNRSTSDDVKGAAIAAGISRISPTRPTAAAPPWS